MATQLLEYIFNKFFLFQLSEKCNTTINLISLYNSNDEYIDLYKYKCIYTSTIIIFHTLT